MAKSSQQVSFSRPPEWTNEDRMHFLLAPFPQGSSPSPHDPKLTFWTSLILNSSKVLNKPFFTEEELKTRFRWDQNLSPCCLGTVLETMERSGVVVKEGDFMGSSGQVGWVVWGLKAVTKPVSWALSSYLPSGSKYSGRYIIAAQVKEYAEEVIAKLRQAVVHKSTDMVMKITDFDTVSCSCVSADVLPLVKASLSKEKAIVIQPTELGYDVLKVCDGRNQSISEVDVGIVRIKEAVRSLQEQVDSLSQRVQKLKQLAKENIHNKKKAIRLLRQSKMLEGLLEKRESGLENLQIALHKIQSAETDTMILEAYKSSVSALKSVREGLTLEKAEEVVDELREVMEENQEVTDVLSAGVGNDLEYDEDELEKELAELMQPRQTGPGSMASPIGGTSASALEAELEARLASLSLQDLPSPPPLPAQSKDKTELNVRNKRTPMPA